MTLPQSFIDKISRYDDLRILSDALDTEPEVSLRINPSKSALSALDGYDRVPWCETGIYLDHRPKFTFDPKIHQGVYYVQDASSMAIYAAIKQIAKSPVRYLDACAAPGGKTTTALSALPDGSIVVANEYDYKRAEILAENIAKWGNVNVVVSRGDTSRLRKLKHYFDIVAIDAPCSGEGMMRKDAVAREQWSESLVEQCARTQREIIDNVWQSLRPGGYLIYSTCTFNCTENEENLQWIIDKYEAEPIDISALDEIHGIIHGIDSPYPCYRFIPGHVRGEGLFMALVKKPGTESVISFRAKPAKPSRLPNKVCQWVKDGYTLIDENGETYAMNADAAPFIRDVATKLDCLSKGVHVATLKGHDIIPAHDFALSQAIDTDAFATCELDKVQALAFLRRDTIKLPDSTSKGIVLLTYDRLPLGFVKNLGNRCNSLLPKNWRIRTCN